MYYRIKNSLQWTQCMPSGLKWNHSVIRLSKLYTFSMVTRLRISFRLSMKPPPISLDSWRLFKCTQRWRTHNQYNYQLPDNLEVVPNWWTLKLTSWEELFRGRERCQLDPWFHLGIFERMFIILQHLERGNPANG